MVKFFIKLDSVVKESIYGQYEKALKSSLLKAGGIDPHFNLGFKKTKDYFILLFMEKTPAFIKQFIKKTINFYD